MAKDYITSREATSDETVLKEVVQRRDFPVKWYRSTFYNAIVLGICNFLAPGIWGAMNSLGAGGQQSPGLVNAANALTFGLMVLSCFLTPVLIKYTGIKIALIFGTAGYAPYAAGLYCNNRYGNEWFVLLGAALCGISAGVFWSAEAAIALSYPEGWNQGRFLGFWLSFRIGGQLLGGAINLGMNVNNDQAGKVSYVVFLIFIALQALGPFAGLLLNNPSDVQRKDGIIVKLSIATEPLAELKATARLFASRNFLLIVPLIGQAVYTEAVMFTFQSLWFSVRARALGSFLSAIVAMLAGNILGAFLDYKRISLGSRARNAFIVLMVLQGAWWTWATIIVTNYHKTQPTFDWTNHGFSKGFALFLFWVAGFQLNYLYLYFLVGSLAKTEEETIRFASLLRGTESAWQAVSYGLSSVSIMGQVGSVYLNFGLWAISVPLAWIVVKEVGESLGNRKALRELRVTGESS